MRPLLTLAVILAFPPAAFAAPAPAAASERADWRRDGVDDRVKAGLTSLGWRLEDDGRALDPKTKAPVSKAVLDKAVLDLRQGARRAALETVNLMLSSGKPLEPGDRARVEAMAADLPPGLAAAILDPKSDLAKARAMADAGLARVAAYFDGGRTMDDRRAAAQPVSAGAPGPRVDLPYYTASEKSVGEKLQASARAEIGRDPFGRTVLSRLDAGGKPALPPIVIEDQGGGVAAQYDYRRGAVVLDRESVVAAVVATVPPRQASALRASLSTRAALLAYLESHPEAVGAVVKDHDVLIVHELTHAWQDRRDPVFREMARGNIPDVQPLEYEEEAYLTQNLYLRSKLANDPASVKMGRELDDYILLGHGLEAYRGSLASDLETASPARAHSLRSIHAIETERLERARNRPVQTAEEQQAKALDLAALRRGRRELAELERAHLRRMTALKAAVDKDKTDRYKLLGSYYLVQGRTAQRATDRSAWLDQAERYAKASGSASLIDEVRKAKEEKE
ncbi:MAG: hypothetical protein NDJ72_02380 [Elusimicrobia bacterium]|nr:hypothetical protein [Elusimicrobiota bacterium]